jgi:hypothetical protein
MACNDCYILHTIRMGTDWPLMAIMSQLRMQGSIGGLPITREFFRLIALRVQTFKSQISGADDAARPLLDVQELL